ncbi:MAG: LON peptidase substrate-binding domain-containing protein [Planctomycetia bacterium]
MASPPLDVRKILDAFDGTLRLFPLPSLVMFPDTLVPLKVFEPRYVAMAEEALEQDGLVGMALLQPGYQGDYEGSPAIFPMLCIGRIVSHERLPNGHITFWLYGLERALVQHELESEPFRRAQVELCPDVLHAPDRERVARQLQKVLAMIPGRRAVFTELRRLSRDVRGASGSPGRLCDAIANVSDLRPRERYELLVETNVTRRLARLAHLLRRRGSKEAPSGPAPRDVSLN